MIRRSDILSWSHQAPWGEQWQVEQDLVISRAIIELFSDPLLADTLRFRGGTALNKLFFIEALRYSEDIDLVRTTKGPIRPLIDRIRARLTPWLGEPRFVQSKIASKLVFLFTSADDLHLKLKVEINTREHQAFAEPVVVPFSVETDWFKGSCDIPTFCREEMLATKLRALLQRNKGRDLIDISHALKTMPDLNDLLIVDVFNCYIHLANQSITRAQAEERMFQKLAKPMLLNDVKPLLRADEQISMTHEKITEAAELVLTRLISRLPGEPWAKTQTMRDLFGMPLD